MDIKSDIQEDDTHVLHGPAPKVPIPQTLLGKDVLEALLSRPQGSAAMIDAFTREKLLYSEFLQNCVNLAAALRILGYQGQNTVLTISSENCLDFFVPMFAALFNGSITAPVSHFYTTYELEHVLNISTPKLVFCSREVLGKFLQVKKTKAAFIEKIILLGKRPPNQKNNLEEGILYLDEFIASVLKGRNVVPKLFLPAEGVAGKTVALILCSSGTTGLPKGVALSHLCLQVRIVQSIDMPTPDNSMGLLPFFHSYGHIACFQYLIRGSTVICFKRFDEDVFLNAIQDFRLGTLLLSPPLAIFFAKSEKVLKYDLSSVKSVFCGAAPLSKSIEEAVKKRLNCNDMRQGYGLTEMTLTVTGVNEEDQPAGSCGTLVACVSGKVRDPDTRRSLGPRQVGELCFKGPTTMMGYYRNEQATKETFTSDGWLRTGDMGYYDENGHFYIVDRIKELIKYNSYQVAPAELEAILINHPKISDAGVVGLPDEATGELPLAFIVKKSGEELTERDVQNYVADLVSSHKRLRGGVIFIDSIPKNPSGKILRRELRQMLKEYHKPAVKSKL